MGTLVAVLDRLIRAAAVVLLLALLASVVIGVVSRQLNRAVPWSDELAQYLLVWTGLIGWTIAARRRSHIRIDVIINLLPRGLRLAMEVGIQLAVIVFAVALLRWGWPLIGRNWDIEWVSLPLSSALLYMPALFAGVVLIGQAIAEIALAFKGQLPTEQASGAQPL
ncbi:MAG: TRAP transporter small permease subunit [Hyphomicrobiales bacterium]|jgi:TRAP-type C4-dicarboxylate transport system permease small subunit|nr:TRAP transporter small permease subunit [Hyphomicrobiales bacterium]